MTTSVPFSTDEQWAPGAAAAVTQSKIPDTLPVNAIWDMADKGNFAAITGILQGAGVPEEATGEVLLSLAQQAIQKERFNSARIILQFLIEALEDKNAAYPIIKVVADIYMLEDNTDMARQYYLKLPRSINNVILYLQSFDVQSEMNKLLTARNNILTQIPLADHHYIHEIVDEIMTSFINSNDELVGEHKRRYEKNLLILQDIAPRIADRIVTDYKEYFQDISAIKTDGNTTTIACDGTSLKKNGVWIPASVRPGTELNNNSLKKDENIIIRCPDAAAGLDFIKTFSKAGKEFYRYECYLVISLPALNQLMAIGDITPLKDGSHVIRVIDEDNLKDDLEEILLKERAFFPSEMINNLGENRQFYQEILRPLLQKYEKTVLADIASYQQKLKSLYPNNFHKKIIKKIKEGKKLKILFNTSRYTTYLQYSIRDMAEGFRQLGHKVFIELERDGAGYNIRQDIRLKNLCEFKPDIIFTIDHLRYETPFIPRTIPFITWVQDLLPNITAIKDPSLITKRDYIFSFSKRWAQIALGKHPVFATNKVQILPVTASTSTYRYLPDTEKIYDVTSVTHLPDTAQTLYPLYKKNITRHDLSSNEAAAIKQVAVKLESYSIEQLRQLQTAPNGGILILEEICHKRNITVTERLLNLCRWTDQNGVVTPFFNHFMLTMKIKPVSCLLINGIQVKTFGNNWDQYPLVASTAGGPIANGKPLNELFNQSRINLNTSPGTTYHMKAPEVIASGNFMMTLLIPPAFDTMPLKDFFKINKEVVFFTDEQDLVTKAQYYLSHPLERQEIAKAAYEKYQKKYSPKTVAARVVKYIGQR